MVSNAGRTGAYQPLSAVPPTQGNSLNNIVILISGGGSNMAAIVKHAEKADWAHRLGARVVAVVSNKADAKAWCLHVNTAWPPPCWTTKRTPAARRSMPR
jgi:folate-dependent phosphoribosylglycinamide formyltransferase PurN